jgi:hypothetical protein
MVFEIVELDCFDDRFFAVFQFAINSSACWFVDWKLIFCRRAAESDIPPSSAPFRPRLKSKRFCRQRAEGFDRQFDRREADRNRAFVQIGFGARLFSGFKARCNN